MTENFLTVTYSHKDVFERKMIFISTTVLNGRNEEVFYIVNKLGSAEYICKKALVDKDDETMNITREDEKMLIKYLLDIMKKHGIITEEEYQLVLYKCS